MVRSLKSPVVSLLTASICLALSACGGGGSSNTTAPGPTLLLTAIQGTIINSPLDAVPLHVTCADGTSGGDTITQKGSYHITVSCQPANYPIVISMAGDGVMTGNDFQFGTSDDQVYKLKERAPLKIAIAKVTDVQANINAVSTLAALPIEQMIIKVKNNPSATKPTEQDVLTAASNTIAGLNLGTTDIKTLNVLTHPQAARLSEQLLESVTTVTALIGSQVSPQDTMLAYANAIQYGTLSGNANSIVMTDSDGKKSIDLSALRTGIQNTIANGHFESASSGANALLTSLQDVSLMDATIKAKGYAREKVAQLFASYPDIAAFNGSQDLTTLAAILNTALATQQTPVLLQAAFVDTLKELSTTRVLATYQEIDTNSTFTDSDKTNRKRIVASAADTITLSVVKNLKDTFGLTISDIEKARAVALVSVSLEVGIAQLNTLAIAQCIDPTLDSLNASLFGVASKIKSDVSRQIAALTGAALGSGTGVTAGSLLDTVRLFEVTTNAQIIASILKNVPALNISEKSYQAAVVSVIDSISDTTDITNTRSANNINTTIVNLANVLSAKEQAIANFSTLTEEVQYATLMDAARSALGSRKIDYAALPTL